MMDGLPDDGMFGLKPGNTALQTGHFQTQEGTNIQPNVISLRYSHPKLPLFNT